MECQLSIGPLGSALSDLQPLPIKVAEGNFLLTEDEETPAEHKHFGCPELSFTIEGECKPCLPGLPNLRVTMPYDSRPRTYEVQVKPENIMHVDRTDCEFSGLGDKVFLFNANDIRVAKKRQYRGCNKSKFYNQFLRRKRR